jgi:hypothetical protein
MIENISNQAKKNCGLSIFDLFGFKIFKVWQILTMLRNLILQSLLYLDNIF